MKANDEHFGEALTLTVYVSGMNLRKHKYSWKGKYPDDSMGIHQQYSLEFVTPGILGYCDLDGAQHLLVFRLRVVFEYALCSEG